MNNMGDLSDEEYQQLMLPHSYRRAMDTMETQVNILLDTLRPVPSSIDWRKRGYVTAVKNQGMI